MARQSITDGKAWVDEIKQARCGEISQREVARVLHYKGEELIQFAASPVYPHVRIIDGVQRGMDELVRNLDGGGKYKQCLSEIKQRLSHLMFSVSKDREQELKAKVGSTSQSRF
jgi:hypothetical protein